MSSLREAIASAIATADGYNPNPDPALWELDRDRYLALADATLDVFLMHESVIAGCRERWEQQARQRIEALVFLALDDPFETAESNRRIVLEALR